MLAIGCFLPFLFLAAGAAIGGWIGANHGIAWGAGIGFLVGFVLVTGFFWAFQRDRSRFP